MIVFNPVLIESPGAINGRYSRDVFAVLDARRLHREASQKGRLDRLWDRLTRRSGRLLELASIEASCRIHTRSYRGVQTVLIRRICGSEGRSGAFDTRFNPGPGHDAGRWISIATAWQMGQALPPVKLVEVGGRYFVLDGHHRVSVACAMGQEYIEAEVTAWQVSGPLPWSTPQCVPAFACQEIGTPCNTNCRP